jgi:hypothetical protein
LEAAQRGIELVGSKPRCDRFEIDAAQLIVDFKENDSVRKAWICTRMGERVINGTSKERKVISYMRSGYIL